MHHQGGTANLWRKYRKKTQASYQQFSSQDQNEHRGHLTNPLTCLSNWAFAEEGCYTVMARGTIEANGYGAVINVLTAVISSPTINADTGMTTDGVEASTPVMAGVWLHETFVDILSTVLP